MHSFPNFEPVQVFLDTFVVQMDNSFVSHLFKTIACFLLLNFLIYLSSIFYDWSDLAAAAASLYILDVYLLMKLCISNVLLFLNIYLTNKVLILIGFLL